MFSHFYSCREKHTQPVQGWNLIITPLKLSRNMWLSSIVSARSGAVDDLRGRDDDPSCLMRHFQSTRDHLGWNIRLKCQRNIKTTPRRTSSEDPRPRSRQYNQSRRILNPTAGPVSTEVNVLVPLIKKKETFYFIFSGSYQQVLKARTRGGERSRSASRGVKPEEADCSSASPFWFLVHCQSDDK